MAIGAHFFQQAILTTKVGQTELVFGMQSGGWLRLLQPWLTSF